MSTQGTLRSGQLVDVLHAVYDGSLSSLGPGASVVLAAGDTAVAANYVGGIPTFPAILPAGSLVTSCMIQCETLSQGAAVATVQIASGGNVLSMPILFTAASPLVAGAAINATAELQVSLFGTAAGLNVAWVVGDGQGSYRQWYNPAAAQVTATEATGGGASTTGGRWHIYISYIQSRV